MAEARGLLIARHGADGSVLTFHRIVAVTADLLTYEFQIQVGSYHDKETFLNGKSSTERKTYSLEAGSKDFDIEGNLVATLYGYLKTLPEFKGATYE